MEVHNVLGQGFLESVYSEAFAVELNARHTHLDVNAR